MVTSPSSWELNTFQCGRSVRETLAISESGSDDIKLSQKGPQLLSTTLFSFLYEDKPGFKEVNLFPQRQSVADQNEQPVLQAPGTVFSPSLHWNTVL